MEKNIKDIRDINTYYSDMDKKVEIQLSNEKNEYVWMNMSNILRTSQIARDGQVGILEIEIDSEIKNILFKPADDCSELTVEDFFQKSQMEGLLIIKDGTILHEEYKGMTRLDKHNWFSVGKTVSSTLMGILIEEGRLSIEDKVSSYIPELAGSEWDTVKIKEVMDMTTGLDSTEHDDEGARLNPESGWYRWAVSIGLFSGGDKENIYSVLRGMKRVKPPYEAFEYNSINTFILELIVENIEDKPMSRVFSERIWSKTGMNSDAYVAVTDDGNSMGFGFISSTLGDLGRYGMIFTPGIKKISEERILSEKIIESIQSGGVEEIYRKGAVGKIIGDALHEDKCITNKYQWDAVFTDGDFFKGGVGGQGLYVSPEKNLVIAWFSNGTKHQEETMARAIAKKL